MGEGRFGSNGAPTSLSSSCMLRSFHQLCSSFSEFGSSSSGVGIGDNTTSNSEALLCHKDPEGFLTNQYQTLYSPSKTQLKTRAVMYDKQIRSLSVGAQKDKATICNDVVNGFTICTDREQLDLFEINSWISLFLATRRKDGTKADGFEVIISEHVLEHFDPMQVECIAAAAFSMLKPGGRFCIAVPDGYKPSPSYQQYIRPGGTASGAGQKHMVSWTADTLPLIFSKVGFQIELREYFTENGKFVSVEGAYHDEGKFGKIGRSFRHDARNKKKPYRDFVSSMGKLYVKDLMRDEPLYTSLWFDAIKPTSCDHVLSVA